MSQQETFAPPNARDAAGGQPIGSARNFVLACIGLVSLLADEVPALLERSVQRGNTILAQAQAEAKQRRVKPSPQVAPQAMDEWQGQLARLGLPSHHDFEDLLQQVTDLEKQIDQIAAQRAAQT